LGRNENSVALRPSSPAPKITDGSVHFPKLRVEEVKLEVEEVERVELPVDAGGVGAEVSTLVAEAVATTVTVEGTHTADVVTAARTAGVDTVAAGVEDVVTVTITVVVEAPSHVLGV